MRSQARTSPDPMTSPHPLLALLGTRLREYREARGLSVTEVARRAGISRRHVTEAEAGRANLTVTRLAALAEALEVRPGSLIDGPEGLRSQRIALLGLRGAGKSTIGAALALALEVPFVELDRRVEELSGLPLGTLFELHGEAGFRRFEAEALERVLGEGDRQVLATSGSIVAAEATFARLRQTCHTIWLRARPEDHLERVEAQGDRRPMRGRPRALEELRAILASREGAYGQCELTVDTSGRDPRTIVGELARRFGP